MPGPQLRPQLLPGRDRPLRQLGEVSDEQPCLQRILPGLRLAAVYVGQVSRALECKVAQSQRQDHIRAGKRGPVFQEDHGAQVEHQQDRQQQAAFLFLQQQAAAPHHQGDGRQMRRTVPAGKAYENRAGANQHQPADLQRHQVVQQQRTCREDQELNGQYAQVPPPASAPPGQSFRCRSGAWSPGAAGCPAAYTWAAPPSAPSGYPFHPRSP